jgi:hypothetical protein
LSKYVELVMEGWRKGNWILSYTLCSALSPFPDPTVVDSQRKTKNKSRGKKKINGWPR